jgi:single-strand DNA-binding protein
MANFNFNKVIIGGRLTSDPELKTTQSGISVTSFTVAVNRRGKSDEDSQSDFFNCTAWKGTAEFVTKFFRKASSICIVGRLQNRNWTDAEGNKRYATDIVVDEAHFVDSKGENTAQTFTAPAPTTYIPSAYTDAAPQFEEIGTDEELPF